MHFEILVEDQSGKKTLDILVPKIIGNDHTFQVHPYKGIGRIPKKIGQARNLGAHMLLIQLPKLLQGYGRTFAGYPGGYSAAVIVVADLDDKCLKTFRQELFKILHACTPQPATRFCIAIEEGEAWLLGDLAALKTAYPDARNEVLNAYKNDSICGTWETLADAVSPGGAERLQVQGWQAVGKAKSEWAANVAQHMDVANNNSPSFRYLCKKFGELLGSGHEAA